MPPTTLVDHCSGTGTTLVRLAVWATPVEQSPALLGVTFSDGVWMSLTPVGLYDANAVRSGELLPVAQAFSSEDFPTRLQTTEVRGHVAWAKEVSPDISCDPGMVKSVELADGGGVGVGRTDATPGITGSAARDAEAVMFAPTLNGTLTWLERGYVVEIAGPYELTRLVDLAQEMTWSR